MNTQNENFNPDDIQKSMQEFEEGMSDGEYSRFTIQQDRDIVSFNPEVKILYKNYEIHQSGDIYNIKTKK